MRRRKAVKAIALSTLSPCLLSGHHETRITDAPTYQQSPSFESQWHQWPDMSWPGPELWGNRLQDWTVTEGRVFVRPDVNRTLHCLTCELSDRFEPFETSAQFAWTEEGDTHENYFGFVLGAKGRFDDYRSAAVFGEGLRAGIGGNGRLFIGDTWSKDSLKGDHRVAIELRATADPATGDYTLRLTATRGTGAAELVVHRIPPAQLRGNLALISHFERVTDSQGKLTATDYGRDHHPRCFTGWIAGAGFKGGLSYGATDEFGYNVVENPVHVHDLQATLLHAMGVDHEKLTFKYQGRRYRLTDVHGNVVKDLLA